jgi:hypothetical protein
VRTMLLIKIRDQMVTDETSGSSHMHPAALLSNKGMIS